MRKHDRPDEARYATSNGVRLSYRLHDRLMVGRPYLVLIQGVGFDADAWAPVLRRLRRRFRLVMLDNRGVGNSDATGWYTISTMAEDVVAVLDTRRTSARRTFSASASAAWLPRSWPSAPTSS